MSNFEQWWIDYKYFMSRNSYGDCRTAYLAGQASAEQWVKELEKKCSGYALLTKAQEEQLTNHRNHAARYHEAINTMQSERDANAILTAELAALKAQAGEHVHCENCGYPMYPTTEPVKAQAGEPYSDGMTAEDDKQFNRQWDVKLLTPQWNIDADWLYSVLRYADKNPDIFPEVAEGKVTLDGSDAQIIIDALNNTHPTTEPVKAQSITDAVMDVVDRLGSEWKEVDPRAWEHLRVYIPTPERRVPAELIPDHTYETGKRYAINYVAGWNDCRKAMLNAAPKQEETK